MGTQLATAVGKRIRKLRLGQGYSQEEFAHLCNLHRTYIGGIERGERNITLKTLQTLATALHVTPVDLLTSEKRRNVHQAP